MSEERFDLELRGCTPVPLATYLKALGILRLVSEQVDKQAKGWWQGDSFILRSTLDRDGLTDFFLNKYQPTPLVTPWNGGSGFFPKDNQTALNTILEGKSSRFIPFQELILLCKQILSDLSLQEKPSGDDKPLLLQHCRNRFPDTALPWLDAAFLLTDDGPKYPPLLGTGGNDGRLDFINNYMQRLTDLFDCDNGTPLTATAPILKASLFGAVWTDRSKSPIGQFDPGSAGGANAEAGFDGAPGINLWDYVFMLEGAIAFAAASLKKLEHAEPGVLAYPFCVRAAGVGFASADQSDEALSRSEMWMPLWSRPTDFTSLKSLLAEGKADVNVRHARNGVDFARAIASLGIDRGLNAFQRFGFQQRNGLAYFAVPLGRFEVRSQPSVEELLSPIDDWLSRFRRAVASGPARAGRALRQLESAIFQICQRGSKSDACDVLMALGECEATIALSDQLRDPKLRLSPLLLSPLWLHHANDESLEFRLAASLASITHRKVGPIRRHLEPIDPNTWRSSYPKWSEASDDPNIVWGGGGLIRNLNSLLIRRLIQILQFGKDASEQELLMPLWGRCAASLPDLADFIDGHVNDQRIEALLKGLMLVRWNPPADSEASTELRREIRQMPSGPTTERTPDAAYCLLKLCHLAKPVDERAVKLAPQITHRAVYGDLTAATQLASRRLFASGFQPAVDVIAGRGERCRRIAAALTFPIRQRDAQTVLGRVLRHSSDDASEESVERIADSVDAVTD